MERKSPQARHGAYLLLLCLAGFHLMLTFFWLSQDVRHPYGDEILYWEMTKSYSEVLENPSKDVFSSLSDVHPHRPPLYPFLNSFLFPLFKGTFEALLTANSFYFGLTALVVYLLGRKFCGRKGALLAAFIFFAYPLFQEISKKYFLETSLTAFVMISFFLYLSSDTFKRTGPSVALGIFFGLGTLTKWTFPLFFLPLALFEGVRILSHRLGHRKLKNPVSHAPLFNFFAFLVLAASLSLLWYWEHIEHVAQFTLWDQEARLWAKTESLFEVQSLFYYFISLPLYFNPLYFVLFLTGLAFSLYRSIIGRELLASRLFVLFFGSLVCFSFFITKEGRHLLPVYPAAALLSLGFWQRISNSRIRFFIAASIVIAGLGGICFSQLGSEPARWRKQNRTILSTVYPHFYFPLREDWKVEEVLNDLEEAAISSGDAMILQVPRIPQYDGMRYFLFKRKLQLEVTGFSYYLPPDNQAHVHYDFEALLEADWILSKEGWQGGFEFTAWDRGNVNRYLMETRRFLDKPPYAFQANHELMGSYLLPDKSRLFLWRKKGPVTHQEREAVLRAAIEIDWDSPSAYLQLAEVFRNTNKPRKAEGFALLGQGLQLLNQEDRSNALALFEKAKSILPGEIWSSYLCARVRAIQNDWNGVESELEPLVKSGKKTPLCLLLLARAYRMQEKFSQAIPLMRELSTERPFDPEPHLLLEEIYRISGAGKKASLEDQIGRVKVALQGPERGETPKLWASLGLLLLETGRIEEGIEAFRHAASYQSEGGLYQAHLGDALQKAGRSEEALKEFRKALTLSPSNRYWRNRVVQLYLRMGQKERALATAVEGLKHTMEPSAAKEIRDYIEKLEELLADDENSFSGDGDK